MRTDVPGSRFKYPLHTAANFENVTIVSLLLEKSKNELNLVDQGGRTPLWLAASEGHLPVLHRLFELGTVDVNFRSLTGRTPLWDSSARGHLDVVEWLLSKNADPHIPDNDRVTPLAKAMIEGHSLVVEAMRKHRATSIDMW